MKLVILQAGGWVKTHAAYSFSNSTFFLFPLEVTRVKKMKTKVPLDLRQSFDLKNLLQTMMAEVVYCLIHEPTRAVFTGKSVEGPHFTV